MAFEDKSKPDPGPELGRRFGFRDRGLGEAGRHLEIQPPGLSNAREELTTFADSGPGGAPNGPERSRGTASSVAATGATGSIRSRRPTRAPPRPR